MKSPKISDLALQAVEYRLEAWARWKRISGQLPVEAWNSSTILGRLIDQDWAALIHGQGFKPEPEYEDEERIEQAIGALPHYLGRVIVKNYLSFVPQSVKAKELKLELRTYKDYLSLAKHRVIAYVDGLKKSA